MTAAHYDAAFGGMPEPTPENEASIKAFSTAMKLEPFQRGMKELAPTVWLTALRKVQNPNRAGLDIVSEDKNFNSLKVSPLFYWSDADMEKYLAQHNLPNEWDYFDPAKADEKRECGLHANWGGAAVSCRAARRAERVDRFRSRQGRRKTRVRPARELGRRGRIRRRRNLNNLKQPRIRSEEHTSELQSLRHLVCRLLLEK